MVNAYFQNEIGNVQASMAEVLREVGVKEEIYVAASMEHEQGEESLFSALNISMHSPFEPTI